MHYKTVGILTHHVADNKVNRKLSCGDMYSLNKIYGYSNGRYEYDVVHPHLHT